MEPTLTRQTPAQHIVWLDVVRLVAMFTVNAARKSKVDDNTARMQSIKQLGV